MYFYDEWTPYSQAMNMVFACVARKAELANTSFCVIDFREYEVCCIFFMLVYAKFSKGYCRRVGCYKGRSRFGPRDCCLWLLYSVLSFSSIGMVSKWQHKMVF